MCVETQSTHATLNELFYAKKSITSHVILKTYFDGKVTSACTCRNNNRQEY